MNDTMFQRLLWKEYRTQRGLWLGVAGMGLVLQLIVLMVTDQIDSIELLVGIPLVLPVFYAMGSAAVTFASEKEDQTWDRLRILATTPGRLFLAKFGFSIASTLIMAAVLFLLSWGMTSGRISESRWGMINSQEWMLIAGELLLWGTFLSMLTRRVLSAVCLTPLLAFSFASVTRFGEVHLWTYRLAMMGCLFLASIGLSRRWLKRETLGWPLPWSISLRRKQANLLTAVETASPQRRLFKRLKWQEHQQARTVFLIFVVLGISLISLSHFYGREGGATVSTQVMILTPLICGVWVFRGEQEGKRFRFLVEQGAVPQTIWLSKHRVWAGRVIVLLFLFLLSDITAHYVLMSEYSLVRYPYPLAREPLVNAIFQVSADAFTISDVLLYVCLTYSIGQFVSMLFSRSVTAAFLGFVFTGLFLAWLLLMLRLNVPRSFSVWPIPLVLLGATYVRSSDWMLERTGWRQWLKLGSALIASVVFIIAGVAYHRVTEIELPPEMHRRAMVSLLELAAKPATSEERKTAELYRRAIMKTVTRNASSSEMSVLRDEQRHRGWSPYKGWDHATPEAKTWLEDNQEALLLTLEASRRDSCAVYDPTRSREDQLPNDDDFNRLNLLVLTSARQLESEDKLDEAWERYLASLRMGRHLATRAVDFPQWKRGFQLQRQTLDWLSRWIAHPAQTKERLVTALKEIQRETDDFPSPINSLKTEYWHWRNTFLDHEKWNEHIARFYGMGDREEVFVQMGIRRCFPWEKTRTLQLYDEQTYRQLNLFLQMEQTMNRRGKELAQWVFSIIYSDSKLRPTWKWQKTTPLFESLESDYAGWMRQIIDGKTEREATLLTLALVAYRKEHGELPRRLDQLVGKYLANLPLDSWSGGEFAYRPEGFPTAVQFHRHTAEPGEPLLWSTGLFGANVIGIGENVAGLPLYRVAGRKGLDKTPDQYGRAFPIPK